jgi:hypothetical protein
VTAAGDFPEFDLNVPRSGWPILDASAIGNNDAFDNDDTPDTFDALDDSGLSISPIWMVFCRQSLLALRCLSRFDAL